jgi:hypothetical protein
LAPGLFEEALEALAKHQHKLDFMFENIVPLSKAVEYYDLFNQMKVQKVVFEADKVGSNVSHNTCRDLVHTDCLQ